MQGLLYSGYVKSASEGTDRMREEMVNLGLPEPEFQDDKRAVLFKVVLRNNIKERTIKSDLEGIEELNQNIVKDLDDYEKKIVHFLIKNKIGAPADFEKEINKARATVIRRLRHLEELDAIGRTEKVGPNVKYKLTKYMLLENISVSPIINKEMEDKKQQKLL